MTFTMYFIRHSKANYKYINMVLASNDPTGAIDFSKQELDDVPDAGIKLAQDKAQALFSQLDPNNTILFFGASVEARAFQTAQIFKQVALQKGFKIMKAGSGWGLKTPFTDSHIRKVRNLSIKSKNNLLDSVYTPLTQLPPINWDAVLKNPRFGPRFKELWEEARRKFVDVDDKGSWGANFSAYSEIVTKFFKKEFKSISKELRHSKNSYDIEFKNVIRLGKWCAKKVPKGYDKDVVVLGFAHENSVVYLLSKYFPNDNALGNCEAIKFEFDNAGMKVTHENKVVQIANLK